MPKLWFHKKKNVWCSDVLVDGKQKRYFFVYQKQASERAFRKLLRQLYLAGRTGKVDEYLEENATEDDVKEIVNQVSTFCHEESKTMRQSITVKELSDRFLSYVETNLAPKSYEQYRNYTKRFVMEYGKKPAEEVSPFDLEDYKKWYINNK